jgi:hypothetical protein
MAEMLEIGSKIHDWTILEYLGKDKNWQEHYLCKCECGKVKKVRRDGLTTGGSTSCGCKPVRDMYNHLLGTKQPDGWLEALRFTCEVNSIPGRKDFFKVLFVCFCRGCDKECFIAPRDFSSQHVKSCGCKKIPTGEDHGSYRHGQTNTHLYSVIKSAMTRCHNPNYKQYKNWGARGITVCEEWRKFPEKFIEWAYDKYPNLDDLIEQKYQLDRIDNEGNYEPDNCQFITCQENSNKRTNNAYYILEGVKMSLADAVRKYGVVKYVTVNTRLQDGWDIWRALTQPKRESAKKERKKNFNPNLPKPQE